MTKKMLVAIAVGVTVLGAGGLLAESRLTAAAEESKDEAGGKTVYTCSMHPQIVQDEPGTCPICGMDLVPKKIGGASAGGEAKGGSSAAGGASAGDAKVGTGGPGKGRKIDHWVAPMDPTYISDKPGKSPMGMDLVPVYADEAKGGSPGTVTIDPVVVQNAGVRIAPVRRGTITRRVRTIGTVDVAENEVSVVNLRYSGWIEHIYVDETGAKVKKGQALFDIYSPDLVSAEQEYLIALRSGSRDSLLVKSARSRLELWDLPAWQIAKIEKAGQPLRNLTVVAPQSGYVLHKNVVEGARVQAGVDLYRIGDLDKIWVNADVYEFDAPWIQVGQPATMELSFEAGKTYDGRVSYIYPTLNPKTRTLAVRLEFENPGLALKPGMFATVEVAAQHKDGVLEVPTESIIHTGARQVLFVAKKELGKYEMREVTTGLTGDDHVTEILSGVSEGERVVTSGQFLLDSESQLQEAVQKLLETRLQAKQAGAAPPGSAPQASAATGAKDSSGKAQAGDTYWTCGMHPQVVQDHPGTCPICGMDLIEKKK